MSEREAPKGTLLIANPAALEATFHRTLVLVMDHDEDSALGVILNRPTDRLVGDIVPTWAVHASPPAVLFGGGPVQAGEAVIAVARGDVDEPREGWSPFWNGLATVDLEQHPADLGVDVRALRVFAGYAGWGPGQLDDELERGMWLVTDARDEDVFTSDPDALWRRVLGRQPGQRAWLANFPPVPSLN